MDGAKQHHRRSAATDSSGSGATNTLSTEVCDCFIGALLQLAEPSLRADLTEQERSKPAEAPPKKAPKKARRVLTLDQRVTDALSLDAEPMHLNLVGLRRRGSLTNRFDDVILALYREPERDPDAPEGFLLPAPQPPKGKLPADQLRRTANEKAALDLVRAVSKTDAPPGWPTPGEALPCKQHLHWRVIAFANTTDPGYIPPQGGPQKAREDDARRLPWGIAAVEPGKHRYRVGFHHFSKWGGYVAGQASARFPALRRYAVVQMYERAARAAEIAAAAAVEPKTKKEKALVNQIARDRARARATPQAELDVPFTPSAKPKVVAQEKRRRAQREKHLEKQYFSEERAAECERRNPAAREPAYRAALFAALSKHEIPTPIVRLEDANSKVLEELDGAGRIGKLLVAPAPGVGRARWELEIQGERPGRIVLGEDHVLVVRTTAGGTNLHRSVRSLKPGTKPDARRVDNYSEGCQVFRDPEDFFTLLRLLQLSKRVQCGARGAECTARPITAERLVEKLRREKGAEAEFARSVLEAQKCEQAWAVADRAPPSGGDSPQGAAKADLDRLKKEIGERVKAVVLELLGKKFMDARRGKGGARYVDDVVAGVMAKAASVLDARPEDWDADAAVTQALGSWEKSLRGAKDAWLRDELPRYHSQKASELTRDYAETCDFEYKCLVTFPYLLVELEESDIRGLLGRLRGYSFDALFPGTYEDLPGNPTDGEDGSEGEQE